MAKGTFWKFSQKTFCQIYLEEFFLKIVKIFGGFGQISSSFFLKNYLFIIYKLFINLNSKSPYLAKRF
jgi:hypothetical protein